MVLDPFVFLYLQLPLKAKLMVAKYDQKIANQRLDYLQKVTTLPVRQYDSIHMEDLKTKNLLKKTNRHYSLNEAEYEKLIEFAYECYDMEKTLTEFLNGKYTSKQIKQ